MLLDIGGVSTQFSLFEVINRQKKKHVCLHYFADQLRENADGSAYASAQNGWILLYTVPMRGWGTGRWRSGQWEAVEWTRRGAVKWLMYAGQRSSQHGLP